MKSNLTQKEFKERLESRTTPRQDFYIITPYDFSGRPFTGTYDDTKFELRKNSFWRHVIAIQIKGEYKPLDNNSTEVNYEIALTKFGRYLTFIFGGLSFIGLNILFFIERETFDFGTAMAINTFFGFSFLLGWTVNCITKRIINQKFKEEFEIGVKDEWATHSDSLIYRRFTKN